MLDDALVEGAETITVALANPTGGATLGAQGSATVTIVDNDTAAQPPPAPPSKGGGAFGWWCLALLTFMPLMRRRTA